MHLKVQNRSIQRNFLTKTKAHMSPMMNVDILNVETFKIDLELHVTRVLLSRLEQMLARWRAGATSNVVPN